MLAGKPAEGLRVRRAVYEVVTDSLRPEDLREGMTVELAWSPKGGRGAGDSAAGEVTRVWRPDDEVEEFTVETSDRFLNVYTEYRDPPVERVEDGDGDDDPDAETIGRLDEIRPAEGG